MLTNRDYTSMIQFMTNLDWNSKQLEQSIQKGLSEKFGLHYSMCWRSDQEQNMYDLKFYNTATPFNQAYQSVYMSKDLMHPKKLLFVESMCQQTVFTINDIASFDTLRKSDYYPFYSSYQMKDQMVLYFIDRHRILGGIGFSRFGGDRPFSKKDQEILQTLSVYLKRMLVSNEETVTLSTREKEIFQLVVQGKTNEEISFQLWISVNTVKKHLQNMYQKCDVKNRTELIYKLT
ncbi:helix-turn-helix transcriptional regulator [Geomicrobium sediminis]|uniref:DNA-binding CsgD family transcriptional regulator n=1 Tax=Geomicrobium sediminis TaxID=1347788 RepID=A0ABS2PAI8_9BACL|nr:helix-turn-helix transcriptional regulator [Geomicrobium sediminis]MBM7632327.1 DNA-binding CsgD family transcriptional regulator [Geomicrobium sediminis]